MQVKWSTIFGIIVAIISVLVMSLFLYYWNQERAYKAEVNQLFSEEITSIELHSRLNNMPIFKIKEQQKILMIKAWLLNARGPRSFNLVPYPDALDKIIIMQSSNEKIVINISPPDPARSKIQYKNHVMFSTPPPDIIEEVKLWNQAYENRLRMWSNSFK